MEEQIQFYYSNSAGGRIEEAEEFKLNQIYFQLSLVGGKEGARFDDVELVKDWRRGRQWIKNEDDKVKKL